MDMQKEYYILIIFVLLLVLFIWNCQSGMKEGLGIVDRSPNVIPKYWKQRSRFWWDPWWVYKNGYDPAVPMITRFPLGPEHSAGKHWSMYWLTPYPNEVYVGNQLKSGCGPEPEEIGAPVRPLPVDREEEMEHETEHEMEHEMNGEEPEACEERMVYCDSLPYDLRMDETEAKSEEEEQEKKMEGMTDLSMMDEQMQDGTQKHLHHHYYPGMMNLKPANKPNPQLMPLVPYSNNGNSAMNGLMRGVNLSVFAVVLAIIIALLVVYYQLYR